MIQLRPPSTLSVIAASLWLAGDLRADQFGDFTYTDHGTYIEITDWLAEGAPFVQIPENIIGKPVTAIGDFTFTDCWMLSEVIIPATVTSIGDSAFSRCGSLTSITVDSANPNFSSVGGVLFNRAQTALIRLPGGFDGSYAVPATVTSIGIGAFRGCGRLASITVDSANPNYSSLGGTLFDKAQTTLIQCPGGFTGIGIYTVPASVTSIGDSAFERTQGLEGVMIPASVTSIGGSAFSGCYGLNSIVVDPANPSYSSVDGMLFDKAQTTLIQCPGGFTGSYSVPASVTGIGDLAFRSCTRLNGVTLPVSVTSIGESAFEDCRELASVTIPPSVARIGASAFRGCRVLTGVTIPASVTRIGDRAFSGCKLLYAITVDSANPSYSSVDGILFDKAQTSLIRFPDGQFDYPIPSSVTSIEGSAFEDCWGLQGVTIPSSVISIGDYAFAGCEGLATVSFGSPSSLTSIGDSAFHGCARLSSVTIPASVSSIGDSVFSGCERLASITVDAANPNYSSLCGVLFDKAQTTLIRCPGGFDSSCTIPATVTSIGVSAFEACGGLRVVTIPASVAHIRGYAFRSCGKLAALAFESPSSLTSIGASAFEACDELAGVTIPGSVTSIGDSAFMWCTRLETLGFGSPSSLVGIGDNAFSGCEWLATVTIPASVTSIGDGAFAGCGNLATLDFESPSSLTSIGGGAFAYCGWLLNSVTIPASVTSIGDSAFSRCGGLTTITVDAANPNYSSLGGVLFDKAQTTLIQFPSGFFGSYTIPSSVTIVGDSAFEDCQGLAGVAIPASVTTIGDSAFAGCNGLATVSFGSHSSLTSIGESAFRGCDALASVTIPASVISIGDDVFEFCDGLTSLDFESPSSLTSIGDHAFHECDALTNVAIPASLTSIGDYAFYSCDALTGVTVPASASRIGEFAFSRCSGLTAITVDPANPSYSSVGGVLFDKAQTSLIQFPPALDSSYTVPATVATIGVDAFRGCRGLVGVMLPASLISIGDEAFAYCNGLASAVFLGDAPMMGPRVFTRSDPSFTVYYFSSKTGFSSPEWHGYPAASMGSETPVKLWLIGNRLPYDADMGADTNGDGVPLLMAYALSLDPAANLSASLPQPVVSANQMTLTFRGDAEGILYNVEASIDLYGWDTEGITMSEPDAGGFRTATVEIAGRRRFLRLVVRQ